MANQVGKWAFIVGAVLALIMGIGAGLGEAWGANPWLKLLLVVLGLVVGFVNISMKEIQGFLLATVTLLVANSANIAVIDTLIPKLGLILQGMITNILVVVAPAALVVSLRAVYKYAAE